MIEKAKVIAVNDEIVTLVCGDAEGCASCAAHGFCATDKKTFEAWNSKGFPIEPGSNVEVFLPTGKTIGSAFMVMIFPLVLFFLFFYGAGMLFDNLSEGRSVLAGLAGIAAGFGINFLVNRKPDRRKMPEITGLLD